MRKIVYNTVMLALISITALESIHPVIPASRLCSERSKIWSQSIILIRTLRRSWCLACECSALHLREDVSRRGVLCRLGRSGRRRSVESIVKWYLRKAGIEACGVALDLAKSVIVLERRRSSESTVNGAKAPVWHSVWHSIRHTSWLRHDGAWV